MTPVFLGKVTAQDAPDTEYSEAIAGTIRLTKEEVYKGLAQGFLEVSVNGQKKQVLLRDAFLTFALLQAQIRKSL